MNFIDLLKLVWAWKSMLILQFTKYASESIPDDDK